MPDLWRDMQPPLVVSLVTTVDKKGRANASPKTWWTPTSYKPPLMVLSLKPDSHTAMNIAETGTWVLHLPNVLQARQVLHTAKPLPRGECELDDVGLVYSWLEHDKLPKPVPVVAGMPYVVCWAVHCVKSGDHMLYEGQGGLAGGFERDLGVENVLLHRGKNVFVAPGPEFEVEPY